jgi:hypothetical protein
MPAAKWTDAAVDLNFLMEKIPGYSDVYAAGKVRVKNHARDGYLQEIVTEYINNFPGRLEAMDLPGIGLSGDNAKRHKTFQEVSARDDKLQSSIVLIPFGSV